MEQTTLTVPGISCGHCVMAIKNELGELEGVASVDGSPKEKSITVQWDAPATLETIRTALQEINYPAD